MNLENKSQEELRDLAKGLTVLRDRYKYNFIESVFPDHGKLRRELYPKHIEFLNGGKRYHERLFSAANQIGKTLTLLIEGFYHASGLYPKWWDGKVFKRPTIGIFGAESWEHIRSGIQAKLLKGGDRGFLEMGCGIIPKHLLDKCKFVPKANVTGVYAEILIPHVTGGMSSIMFKTYDRQEAWESMTVNWVMLDEEPPLTIYTEAAMRIIKNSGTIAIGFTPDSGITKTVLHFFKDNNFLAGAEEGKLIVMVGWDDVPHLTERDKKAALATIPEYLREAKTKGIPYLGEGRVFQFDLNTFVIPPFQIPEHYERVFALDPGIRNAAVLWAAIDPDTGTYYITDEFSAHQLSIYTVADAIKAHGQWIPGVMDPFYGVQSSRESAKRIIDLYKECGLNIELCERSGKNFKEGGIESIKVLFLSGRCYIFSNCAKLQSQLNVYYRTDKGTTGNTPDDFVDALRYLATDGRQRALSYIDYLDLENRESNSFRYTQEKRNKITGY